MFMYNGSTKKQTWTTKNFNEIGSMSAFNSSYSRHSFRCSSVRFYLDEELLTRTRKQFHTIHSTRYSRNIGNERQQYRQPEERLIRVRPLDAIVDVSSDIRPIYNEEPMAEVQMTADDNVSATGNKHYCRT
ncbi:hypothetical protein Tco_1507097 [Tanacetum coccineum]